MKVFVKNINNEPLMPTSPRKARILLKSGKAEVDNRTPFTIKLLYPCGNAKQEIILGIDTGYSNIGFSAVTEKEELISGEVQLLSGMVERNQERVMYRRNRKEKIENCLNEPDHLNCVRRVFDAVIHFYYKRKKWF